MVKAIAITNNLSFMKKLSREINAHHLGIRIVDIVSNKSELSYVLSSLKPDIIFLDKPMKKNLSQDFLIKYRKIITELVVGKSLYLIDKKALKDLKQIIELRDFAKKKVKVIKELESIGYKFKYKGTHYLVDTILHMYANQDSMIDNLQSSIYPIIAAKYKKTVYNIKSSIDKATDCMYCDCDSCVLQNYFKFFDDTKPTVKEVVYTVMNRL